MQAAGDAYGISYGAEAEAPPHFPGKIVRHACHPSSLASRSSEPHYFHKKPLSPCRAGSSDKAVSSGEPVTTRMLGERTRQEQLKLQL